MQNLIIQMNNGVPEGHPMLLDNFIQAFPNIDLNSLPSTFKYFQRVSRPNLGVYQVFDPVESVYELQGDIVTEVWKIRDMTIEEKQDKINMVLSDNHPVGFVFNEENCMWEPPIPYPTDGKKYLWDEQLQCWTEFQFDE